MPTDPSSSIPTGPATPRELSPLLHDLVTCLRSPSMAISSPEGPVRDRGVQGFYRDDVRYLSELVVGVSGAHLEPVAASLGSAARASFQYVARGLGDEQPDPTVWVTEDRVVDEDGLEEVITVSSAAREPVTLALDVAVSADFAPLAQVRSGQRVARRPGSALGDGSGLRWTSGDGDHVALRSTPAPDHVTEGSLTWSVHLEAGQTQEVRLSCRPGVMGGAPGPAAAPSSDRPLWSTPVLQGGDDRLTRLIDQSVDDLEALLRRDPANPADRYLAAGSPWYLTLFGRDSLWAARMLLPLGTDLALQTLRTLARRQGTCTDPRTGEQPGKILHELRRDDHDHELPPVYYGTSDATSLWVTLLFEAWRWGAPRAEVADLLPHLLRALEWLEKHADSNGDGLVDYAEVEGLGSINQGWKDSRDSIHNAAGELAPGPITLCEVQAYAHEAALAGAALLDELGAEGGGESWRGFARDLKARFRSEFWPAEDQGGSAYPALALDGEGRRADALSSNIGHLLGTGILDPDEASVVAAHLASPELCSPFGLRTLALSSPRYNPVSYHNGSVWAHDTAIAVQGLVREGAGAAAARLATGVVAAGPAFGYRLPELWGGDPLPGGTAPLVYPAACRPQAWSAAASIAILSGALGLDVNAQARCITLAPMRPMPFGAFTVAGLRVAGHDLTVSVLADGSVADVRAPAGYEVQIR